MNTYTFKTNINCGSCIKSVSPSMNELDNVESWKVNVDIADKILTVQLDDDNYSVVVNAVKNAGYEIELVA